MKKVIYNGGTLSYYGASDPVKLKIGQVYEVIEENVRDWQTDYTLKGIEGNFNSTWFDDLLPTYLGYTNNTPVVGERCVCLKDDYGKLIPCHTSIVQSVQTIGERTYKVRTQNSIYVLKVCRRFK